MKEGNIRTNMTEEDLSSAREISFSKNEKIDLREKMINSLKNGSIGDMRQQAIRILAEIGGNFRPTRSAIDGLVIEYYTRNRRYEKVYDILYPFK